MRMRANETATRRDARPRQAGQRGFTLIEVLVAVALMAIVSVMAWRGLDSVIRTRDHVQRDADRDDALLRVLGQLQQDVQMRASDAVLNGGTANTAVVEDVLPAAVRVNAGHGGNGALQIDIVRGPALAGRWQRVRWWRDGDVLRRATAASGDTFPLPEPGNGADVLDGVIGFDVEAWIPGRGWTALPTEPGTLATGLAFVLRLAKPVAAPARPAGSAAGPASGPAQVYRRVVALP